jgi:translation elongation factor EF-G
MPQASYRHIIFGCIATSVVQVADLFLGESPVPPEVLEAAIRRATIAQKFQPVFMGSAFKNKVG